MPSITNLTTTACLNANINEIKNKIPDITNLATSTALTGVKTKIPYQSKNITTPEFNIRKFYCKISTTKSIKKTVLMIN